MVENLNRAVARRTRASWGAVALGVALLGLPLAVRADEGDCQRLGMEVTCTVKPGRVVLVGDPFEVTAVVRNTGNLPLPNVTLALAGIEGIVHVGGDELRTLIPKLEPGETRELTSRFICDRVGESRVSASAREQQTWAAAGCVCGLRVRGLPAIQSTMIDLDSNRQPEGVFDVGESFIYKLTVENDMGTAATPELKVLWELPAELEFVSGTGDQGIVVSGSGRQCESTAFELRPNQVQNFEIVVRAIAVPPGNWLQAHAAIVTAAGGQEVANDSESTTIKQAGEQE